MSILTFNATNTADKIDAVWWVELDGIRYRFGTCVPSWNPADTSTNRTILPYLDEVPSCRAQSVEPLNGKTTSHGLTISMLDVSDEVTALMSVHDESTAVWTMLTSACTASEVTLHVTSTSAFTTPCDLYVGSETMYAASQTTLTFAVTRGMYSSVTVDHVLTDPDGGTQTVEVWSQPRYMMGRGMVLRESRVDLEEEDSAGLYTIINGIDEDDGTWTISGQGVLSLVAGKLNRTPAWARTWDYSRGGDAPGTFGISGGAGTFITATATMHPWVTVGDSLIVAYTDINQYAGQPADWRFMTLVQVPPLFSGMSKLFSGQAASSEIPPEGLEVVQCVSHELFQSGGVRYMDPISVLLCLLLSKKGDGTNHATYDILPEGIGLGLKAKLVAVTEIEQLRDELGLNEQEMRFVIKENADAKKWIEENILRPHLLFLVETWDGAKTSLTGAITVKRLMTRNQAVLEGPQLDITEDVLLDTPKFELRSLPIGSLTWKVNYNPVDDEYLGEVNVIFDESIRRYRGTAAKYTLECQSIYDDRIGKRGKVWRSSAPAELPGVLANFVSVVWDRFALNPLPVLTVEVPYNRLTNCYPGNIVRVTSSTTPNVKTKDRGLSLEYFQILEMQPEPKSSCVRLRLAMIGVHDVDGRRFAASAKVHDIQDDYGGLGYSRVFIYKTAFAASSGYADYRFFTVGDNLRFYEPDMTPGGDDTTTYTVRATGTSATYDWIELTAAEVDPPPDTADGSILDTISYNSATATQRTDWAFMAGSDGLLGADGDDGDRRT